MIKKFSVVFSKEILALMSDTVWRDLLGLQAAVKLPGEFVAMFTAMNKDYQEKEYSPGPRGCDDTFGVNWIRRDAWKAFRRSTRMGFFIHSHPVLFEREYRIAVTIAFFVPSHSRPFKTFTVQIQKSDGDMLKIDPLQEYDEMMKE